MIMVSKKEKKEEEGELNIFESSLVPKHEILNVEEKAELLKKLNINLKQLPRIKSDDPTIKKLDLRHGEVVKITRNSAVAGEYFYYRVVV
jgi:DNA-directed RNA polymerase subunit H